MSGNKLAQAMRDTKKLPRAGAGAGGWVDRLIAALAVIAIGGLGLVWWTARPDPPPAAMTAPAGQAAWTPEDTAHCRAYAQKAGSAPVPADMMLANRAVTDGFGIMASMLECQLATKIARLCSADEKAVLVEAVKDYLGRMDLIVTGLHVQGAPMAILGEMLGGEVGAGSAIYDMEKQDTFAFIDMYDARVARRLKALARAGLIQAGDFGSFMGMGVPGRITAAIGSVTAEKRACA